MHLVRLSRRRFFSSFSSAKAEFAAFENAIHNDNGNVSKVVNIRDECCVEVLGGLDIPLHSVVELRGKEDDSTSLGIAVSLGRRTTTVVVISGKAELDACVSLSSKRLLFPQTNRGSWLDALGADVEGISKVDENSGSEIKWNFTGNAMMSMSPSQSSKRITIGMAVLDVAYPIFTGDRIIFSGAQSAAVNMREAALSAGWNHLQSNDANELVYVSAGQSEQLVRDVRSALHPRALLISASAAAPWSECWLSIFSGLAAAEEHRRQGKHCLFIIDDVSKHSSSVSKMEDASDVPHSFASAYGSIFERVHASNTGSVTSISLVETMVEADGGNDRASGAFLDQIRGVSDDVIPFTPVEHARWSSIHVPRIPLVDVIASASRNRSRGGSALERTLRREWIAKTSMMKDAMNANDVSKALGISMEEENEEGFLAIEAADKIRKLMTASSSDRKGRYRVCSGDDIDQVVLLYVAARCDLSFVPTDSVDDFFSALVDECSERNINNEHDEDELKSIFEGAKEAYLCRA